MFKTTVVKTINDRSNDAVKGFQETLNKLLEINKDGTLENEMYQKQIDILTDKIKVNEETISKNKSIIKKLESLV